MIVMNMKNRGDMIIRERENSVVGLSLSSHMKERRKEKKRRGEENRSYGRIFLEPAALTAILCAVLAATSLLLAAIEARATSLAFVVALLEHPAPAPAPVSAATGSLRHGTILNRRSNSLTFTAALFSFDSSPVHSVSSNINMEELV
jgi:hypothetical protein